MHESCQLPAKKPEGCCLSLEEPATKHPSQWIKPMQPWGPEAHPGHRPGVTPFALALVFSPLPYLSYWLHGPRCVLTVSDFTMLNPTIGLRRYANHQPDRPFGQIICIPRQDTGWNVDS